MRMFQTIRRVSFAAVMSVVWPELTFAVTLNVPADYPTIQACIDAAMSGDDECVVAPGTYNETINFLGKAITLRSSGGKEVTTIDATGIGGGVVTCANGEGPNTVLDGFTITGGTGAVVPPGFSYGGGMYNEGSSPTVIRCTFHLNSAIDGGGGMYNFGGSPTVSHCTSTENMAGGFFGDGGGMFNSSSSPTVSNCMFSENIATLDGGGMHNTDTSNPTVTDCTFQLNNATRLGAGMMNNESSSPFVSNCTFRRNIAGEYGGGMCNAYASSPTVANCTFNGNIALAWGGGGMANLYGSPTVTACKFSGNTAGQWGAGMYNDHSYPTVRTCTFSGNVATSTGGGVYNIHSSPILSHCIFWGDNPDEIAVGTQSAPNVRFSDVQGGLPIGAINTGGNINSDPKFVRMPSPGPDGMWNGVNDNYGDLHLRATSPCINTGDPGYAVQPGETDLDGHARVLCVRVDMGAYEFGIGDYDCNRIVDLTDFGAWDYCVTGPSETTAAPLGIGCAAFDFNADFAVDLLDFAGFQRVINAP